MYSKNCGAELIETINTPFDMVPENGAGKKKASEKPADLVIYFQNLDNGSSTAVSLTKELLVGRGKEQDSSEPRLVLLGDYFVARRHCKLYKTKDGLVVEDLHSANGTWLNDTLVKEFAVVRSGDVLKVGKTRLLIQY